MSEAAYKWDLSVLEQMRFEMGKLISVLSSNREMLTSERTELLESWQGKSAEKIYLETAVSGERLESLINRFSELREQLDKVISQCYTPCENEIRSQAARLIQEV